MTVPFINLKAQQSSIQAELDDLALNTLREHDYIRGKPVGEFEQSFAAALKVKHCIATGCGTDSLFIALKALGIGPGDEVITPSMSWISSSETITLCGALPVFCEIHPQTYTLNPDVVEQKITKKTKAIIAVHLYGQAAHASMLLEICKKYHLALIEDCAQAHFTSEHQQYAGTIGTVGAFSFYPTKNLGAWGDAGCIVTHDDVLSEKMRRWANHGALEKEDHLLEGTNSRMDSIQAAVLKRKLECLPAWNERRRKNAQFYMEHLQAVEELQLPIQRPDAFHTFHLFAIRAKRRDALKKFLLEMGIHTMVHYPTALPFLPAYQYLKHSPADFPISYQWQHETLSLPIGPELTEEQLTWVCENIQGFYAR